MNASASLQPRDFTWLGAALLIWGAVNTGFDFQRHGLASGEYWWFCNLALLGTGLGCVIKDRGFVVGFLAIALFTQVFWIIDDLSILAFSRSVFGLAIHRQQPGYPLDEFLLSQYHYFTIPIGILGWASTAIDRGSALRRVALFNPIIYGVSYFCFSYERNINCIHHTCLPDLQGFTGPGYALGFWGLTFGMHLAMAYALERPALRAAVLTHPWQRRVQLGAGALLGLGVLCSLFAMSTKL